MLDHEIVQEVSRHVLQSDKMGYSQNIRVAEYKGTIKTYTQPDKIEIMMQHLIDDFNHTFWQVKTKRDDKKLSCLLADFIVRFLAIHPLKDSNGRVVRLLTMYILESYGFHNVNLDFVKDYEWWCDLIYCQKTSCLQKHLLTIIKSYKRI